MKKLILTLILVIFFCPYVFSQPAQQFADIGNLVLVNGDTLFDCSIGYRIAGEFNKDSSNVIIYPSWYGGNSEYMVNLIGPDKLIDNSDYCIICIDALANGVSSSPSNSKNNPVKNFLKLQSVIWWNLNIFF